MHAACTLPVPRLHPPLVSRARAGLGMPGRERLRIRQRLNRKESQMPKMKTKSSVKKRFKITATGKVKAGRATSATTWSRPHQKAEAQHRSCRS